MNIPYGKDLPEKNQVTTIEEKQIAHFSADDIDILKPTRPV